MEEEKSTFENLQLNRALQNAVTDLGFEHPTPIQLEAYSVIRSGKNVIGISQTGTGKTLAFMLPILQDLKFSKQIPPRVVILVPTRELVTQLVAQIEEFTAYMSHKIVGVYGGANINTQAQEIAQGATILVSTPGRLYDLALNGQLKLKSVQKLIIDEVDVMLDLGFRFQLTNIFQLLPERRQNLMFSATMTDEIEELIEDYFIAPVNISIAVSGTPLYNIKQSSFAVPNFHTKVNLLRLLLKDKEEFKKSIVFVSTKKHADMIFELLSPDFASRLGVIHSNLAQNARFRAIEHFDEGQVTILIATDIIARGLDLRDISHVINFDTPAFPENYMHRIGRTGRAERVGHSILLFTEKEIPAKETIEDLMKSKIDLALLPFDLEFSTEKIKEERPEEGVKKHYNRNTRQVERGDAFHEKKEKNKKENLGNSWKRDVAKKYKKPKSRGDKKQNLRKKKK